MMETFLVSRDGSAMAFDGPLLTSHARPHVSQLQYTPHIDTVTARRAGRISQ